MTKNTKPAVTVTDLRTGETTGVTYDRRSESAHEVARRTARSLASKIGGAVWNESSFGIVAATVKTADHFRAENVYEIRVTR